MKRSREDAEEGPPPWPPPSLHCILGLFLLKHIHHHPPDCRQLEARGGWSLWRACSGRGYRGVGSAAGSPGGRSHHRCC